MLLIPQNLNIRLKGGVNQLSSIEQASIKAQINYSSILADTTGSLKPYFDIPDGCTIISVKPETIQYVIKKKY